MPITGRFFLGVESMGREAKGYIRQRKDGRWEGRYVYQKHQRSIYGKTEYEVCEKLKVIINLIKEGKYVKPNEHTVSFWMDKWYEMYASIVLRPSTFVNYRGIIDRHIKPYFGNLFLKNVSVEMLQRFFNEKMINGRLDGKEGGLSPKTIKNMKHMLNVAFTQALHQRIITYNPVEGVKLPTGEDNEARVLNKEEKASFYNVIRNKHDTIAQGIVILLNCGLRKGELLGLRWENVNFEENYIKINQTLCRLQNFKTNSSNSNYIKIDTYASKKNKTAIYLGPVKTKKANRIIYLTNDAKSALISLFEIGDKYQQESEHDSFNPYGFVLCSKEGKSLEPRVFDDGFKKIIAQANLKDVNVHATRHTFATEAMQKSNDILSISAILGHAQPSTTLNMYGHTFESQKKKLMALFD